MDIYNIDNKFLEELTALRDIYKSIKGNFVEITEIESLECFPILLEYFSYFNIEVIQVFQQYIIIFGQNVEDRITVIKFDKKKIGDNKDCLRFLHFNLWQYINDLYGVRAKVSKVPAIKGNNIDTYIIDENMVNHSYSSYRDSNSLNRQETTTYKIELITTHKGIDRLSSNSKIYISRYLYDYKKLAKLVNRANNIGISQIRIDYFSIFTIFFYKEQKPNIYIHPSNCAYLKHNIITVFPFLYKEKKSLLFTLDIREAILNKKIFITYEIANLKKKEDNIILLINHNKVEIQNQDISNWKNSKVDLQLVLNRIPKLKNISSLPFLPFLLNDSILHEYTQEDLIKIYSNKFLFNKILKLTPFYKKLKKILHLIAFNIDKDNELKEIKFLICIEKVQYEEGTYKDIKISIKILKGETKQESKNKFINLTQDIQETFKHSFKEFKLFEFFKDLNQLPLSSTQYLFQFFTVKVPTNSLEYLQLMNSYFKSLQ